MHVSLSAKFAKQEEESITGGKQPVSWLQTGVASCDHSFFLALAVFLLFYFISAPDTQKTYFVYV